MFTAEGLEGVVEESPAAVDCERDVLFLGGFAEVAVAVVVVVLFVLVLGFFRFRRLACCTSNSLIRCHAAAAGFESTNCKTVFSMNFALELMRPKYGLFNRSNNAT